MNFELTCLNCKTSFEADVGTIFVDRDVLCKPKYQPKKDEFCFSNPIVCPTCKSIDSYEVGEDFLFHAMVKGLMEVKRKQKTYHPNYLQQKPPIFAGKFNIKVDEKPMVMMPREAEKYYRNKIEEDKNNPKLHEKLGNLLLFMFRDDEAIKEYETAIQLDEKAVESYFNLVKLYLRRGDLDKAEEMCTKVLEFIEYADEEKKWGLRRETEGNLKFISGMKRKLRLLPLVIVSDEDVEKIMEKVMTFATKKFPNLLSRASEDFPSLPDGMKYDERVWFEEFTSWALVDLEIEGKTLVKHYLDENISKLSKREVNALVSLMNCKHGAFEVMAVNGKKYILRELFSGEEFIILAKQVELEVGSVIAARLLPIGTGLYGFFGGIRYFEYSEKVKKFVEKEVEKGVKTAKKIKEKFLEYFKGAEVEFKTVREMMEAIGMFSDWLTKDSEFKIDKKLQKFFDIREDEEVLRVDEDFKKVENKRVGVVFENWINVVPFYGYIKDMLTGNYRRVPDYRELLSLVVKGMFIPGPLLRKLVEDNKKMQ